MSIAVFASGNGSNFQRIVECSREENWPLPVSALICDRPEAKALERAKRLGIPAYCLIPKTFPSKERYEEEIKAILQSHQVEWIVLAGYMRLIGPTLLTPYQGRIVNIHPSLLPAFPGKDAIRRAFFHPVKVSGVTVHFVDEGLDTGPIIAQEPVKIEETDTLDTFTEKIHQVEHELYPRVIYQLITGGIQHGHSQSVDQCVR